MTHPTIGVSVLGARKLVTLLTAMVMVVAACTGGDSTGNQTETGLTPLAIGADAPEFPAGVDWLNVSQPLSLEGLAGKVVIPYFWTSSCVNCQGVIEDLERLQAEYPEEVVVIGIHAPKFDAESSQDQLGQFLVRFGIDHPIVDDQDFRVWSAWGVNAWPTTALIDPASNLLGGHSGVGVYDLLKPEIEALVGDFEADLVRTAAYFPVPAAELPPTVLSFPGGIVADPAANRLFIADTNHHRIIVVDLDTGDVRSVIGSGEAGRADGAATRASFNQPQGLALDTASSTLYVADTGNHLVRAVDVVGATVVTVAGTGERGGFPPRGGAALDTALNAPWGLVAAPDGLYVTMAGYHQVWHLDLDEGTIEPSAGSARQGVTNGSNDDAELAEPAAIDLDAEGRLYFADSQSSSVRWVDDGEVGTLAGSDEGLFDFGDEDGLGTEARFQHPLGVAVGEGVIWVTDTYNSKIKRIDPASGEVTTLAGGEAGWQDGVDPLFRFPSAIDVADGRLYVADTANHSVRVVDPGSGETTTLILKGIEQLVPDAEEGFDGLEIFLEPIDVAPGPGQIVLEVTFPLGYKVNDVAPSRFQWSDEGGVVALAPTANGSVAGPSFPLEVEATFAEGEGTVRADLWLVYCEVIEQSICLFDRARIHAPLRVGAGNPTEVTLPYEVVLPEGI